MLLLVASLAALVAFGSRDGTVGAATQFDLPVDGPRGPVTVIGDSVLVGAGAFSPTLPDRLVERGWGPIRFRAAGSATSGLFPVAQEFRSSFWIERWKQEGWDPRHVIVNLGTNDSGFCGSSTSCAEASIVHLLDAIGPGHRIWWPTITKPASSSEMAFNAALRRVEAARTDVSVWDWNAEFDAGEYRSGDGIHLDPDSYRLRSTRMADVFTTTFASAVRVGGDAPLPAAAAAPSTLIPVPGRRVVDTRQSEDSAVGAARPRAGETVRVVLGDAVPDGTTAVALYVTAARSERSGFLAAGPCGIAPDGSTVNFSPGRASGAPTVTLLGADDDVCIFVSEAADVIVDLQAVFVSEASGLRLDPLTTPVRVDDTRPDGRVTELRVDVSDIDPAAEGVAINLAAINADGVGFLAASTCNDKTEAANVNYVGPAPVSASAFVPVDDGEFCVRSNRAVDMIVDVTATLSASGRLAYVPVAPTRMLDTRSGVGGWAPIHGAGQSIDVAVAPDGAGAVTGTLTVVRPSLNAFATGFGCVGDAPTASVNAAAGAVVANSITTGVFGGRMCVLASATQQTAFDVNGWWVDD